MKLREKILLALAFTLTTVLVVMLLFTVTVMHQGYVDLERVQMLHEADQAMTEISIDLSTINSHLTDWAAWDDTYDYALHPDDRQYLKDNNISQTFITCDINQLLIFDQGHHLLFGQGFNQSSGTFEEIQPALLAAIADTPAFWNVTEEGDARAGVMIVGGRPLLLTSQPILTSSFLGPSPGVMMMGQNLDADRVARLSAQAGVPMTLVTDPSRAGLLSSSGEGGTDAVSRTGATVFPLNSTHVVAVSPLPDVAGTGSLLLLVQEPRTIVLQGEENAVTFILTTLLIGLLFVFLSIGFVDRVVLARLNRLITGVRAISKDGGERRISGIAGSDELALLSGAINGMLDELALAHQQRLESEERYRILAESAQDLIFIFRTDGRLTYVNPAARGLLRTAGRESFIGETLGDIFSPGECSPVISAFQRVVETRLPDRIEVDLVIADGAHSFDVEVIPLINPARGGFGAVMGIARDITDLKETEKTIRSTNAYNRSLIEISRDLLIIVDPQGIIRDLNATAEQILGFSREALVGTSLADHFIEAERIGECCRMVLNGEAGMEIEASVRHHLGHQIPLHSTILRFSDVEGRLIGVLVAARDISEEKQVEEDRLKLARLETVGVLVGSLAHQFNNLHTSILGNLTLARSMLYDRDALQDRLFEAEEQVNRARKVTNRLITFSRGGEPLKSFQEVEPLLREAVENCAGREAYRIDLAVDDHLPRVSLDRSQIVEALQQVITNAMEAMPGGGAITVTAEVCGQTTERAGDRLCIRVIDAGQGIPEEDMRKIFELNFTTKEGAAGLGLPLARSVLLKHGGDIAVSSLAGTGTTVLFTMPLGQDLPLDLTPRLPIGRTRVLIMDDEEAITDILRIWLNRRGYDPVITHDGAEAISVYQEAMLHHRPFDIVFLDLIIPGGMGGEETIRRLLALDRAVRAVVCSGYSTDPVMASYREYGFVGLLPKPFRLEAMEEVITATLQGTGVFLLPDRMPSVLTDQFE